MEQALKYENLKIGNTPAILFEELSDNSYLFLHGQGGTKKNLRLLLKSCVQWVGRC